MECLRAYHHVSNVTDSAGFFARRRELTVIFLPVVPVLPVVKPCRNWNE